MSNWIDPEIMHPKEGSVITTKRLVNSFSSPEMYFNNTLIKGKIKYVRDVPYCISHHRYYQCAIYIKSNELSK